MILAWILMSLVLLASGSPQSERNAIVFPEDNGAGLEEFYNDSDEKLWIPGDTDYAIENEFDMRKAHGSFDEFDDSFADLEPFTFISEEDIVELPDWMDMDFNKLSLDKLAVLNNMTDLSDLAGFFGLDKENAAKLSGRANRTQPVAESIDGRSNAEFVEKNRQMATFARCSPEEVTVELPVPRKAIYLPSCVRLKRCGGCCNNVLLSCQPTKVEVLTLEVLKISKSKSSNSRRRYRRSRSRRRRQVSAQIVPLTEENHVECSCQCKIQEQHCDPQRHNYSKDACACVCKNQAEQMKCERSSSLHYWNKTSCSCMCRKIKDCSTGELFSKSTCGCLPAVRFAVGDA